jgi:N-acetylglucosaminyl-diphospho-decaprenol L-rhamnosyltransferase
MRSSVISAVIVTYNSETWVEACIRSLQNALPDAEVIVVDNASGDDTPAAVRAISPGTRVIESAENLGFGLACNAGAEAATGSHVLFLNPDAVVTSVDAQELDRVLSAHPFGLVAPEFEGESDRRRRENSWRAEYFSHTFEALRPQGWRLRDRRYREKDVAWVSGGMLLASREEFLELGGFDPRFFLYYEDRDLSHRYRSAGLPIRTTRAIRGRHAGGTSSVTDELRSGPMAWSLLGWLEYIWIHDGERSARLAAVATLTTLRVFRLGMHALSALGWGRAERKARQLDELFRLLEQLASDDEVRFCPDALRVVRGIA